MLARYFKNHSITKQKITSPEKAFNYIENLYKTNPIKDKELFYVIALDKHNSITKTKLIAIGNPDSVVIQRQKLDDFINIQKPHQILITHNRPYGYAIPSLDDINLTKQIRLICIFNDIKLLDHLIYSDKGNFSFVTEKLLLSSNNYYGRDAFF